MDCDIVFYSVTMFNDPSFYFMNNGNEFEQEFNLTNLTDLLILMVNNRIQQFQNYNIHGLKIEGYIRNWNFIVLWHLKLQMKISIYF